jgi:hypothetical protein
VEQTTDKFLAIMSSPINFICYKWGTKYPAFYVNRLFHSLQKHYHHPFVFTCITDDARGLDDSIIIKDFKTTDLGMRNIFTVEKLRLFDPDYLKEERRVLLDLDILIMNDLTSYFDSYNFNELRFIKNYWANPAHSYTNFHKGACDINSSFVTWSGNQGEHIYRFFVDNHKKIDFLYRSLDKALFVMFREQLAYHPQNMIYSYNFGASFPDDLTVAKKRDDYKVCLFNTSHGKGIELHYTTNWAKQMWESYD